MSAQSGLPLVVANGGLGSSDPIDGLRNFSIGQLSSDVAKARRDECIRVKAPSLGYVVGATYPYLVPNSYDLCFLSASGFRLEPVVDRQVCVLVYWQ